MGSVKKVGVVVVLVLGLCAVTRPASAAFNSDSVENFTGTTLDTETWESYNASFGQISQDNGLTVGGRADYTTRSLTVGVGQRVRADITFLSHTWQGFDFSLYLTSNSLAATDYTLFDSRWVSLAWHGDVDGYGQNYGAIWAGQGGDGGNRPLSLWRGEYLPHLNTRYTFELERLDASSVGYSFYLDGVLGAASVRTGLTDLPDQMYISLGTSGSTVKYGNVTITPEPTSAALLGLGALALLGRRRVA